eukprot:4838138-Pyramimonas_sp.AAC.1
MLQPDGEHKQERGSSQLCALGRLLFDRALKRSPARVSQCALKVRVRSLMQAKTLAGSTPPPA